MLSLRFDPTSKCRPIPVGIPSNFMHAACCFIKCTAPRAAKTQNPKTKINPRTRHSQLQAKEDKTGREKNPSINPCDSTPSHSRQP
jgi:hypothetical protein